MEKNIQFLDRKEVIENGILHDFIHRLSEHEKKDAEKIKLKLSKILRDKLGLMKTFYYPYLKKAHHKSRGNLTKSGPNIYPEINFSNTSVTSVLQVNQGPVLTI